MHPGILALNQLAAATGIQNFDELNENEVNNETDYVYFRDQNQELVQILPEIYSTAYYCDHHDCIIAELEDAPGIYAKYGYIPYYVITNKRVNIKGNK
jgi:antirestriction protein